MGDIINLLPDSVANQIAAGEVIQRPASVIKELVENSIDAGATQIKVIVVGSGRTSIQVIDNGKGMSGTDARMSFERHATSKINEAKDLFALSTMGFRGEALASIAAIANVELRTRREEDEMGTMIEISGSEVETQEMVQCPKGTSFTVKNLFYNVPARRKFLKSDETEMRNILQEMHRIMLVHYDVGFQFYNGSDMVYDLLPGTFLQRIVSVSGKKTKNISQKLMRVDVETSFVNIVGYVGTPDIASKNPSQYFFVNGRYMNHPYFRRAVMHAFERMLPSDMSPMYFLSLEVDPSTIDVNIHPTKTEIKFEDEKAIWSILAASVKESLGKFNVAPTIDFEMDNSLDIPVQTRETRQHVPSSPTVSYSPGYSPFSYDADKPVSAPVPRDWEKAFEILRKEEPEGSVFVETQEKEQVIFEDHDDHKGDMLVYKNKYLCMPMKSGLMMIDVRRALLRVEYDDLCNTVGMRQNVSQKVMFPDVVEFNAEDLCIYTEIEQDLSLLGFEFRALGKYIYSVDAIPGQLGEGVDVHDIIDNMILAVKEKGGDVGEELRNIVCLSLAQTVSRNKMNRVFSEEERQGLVGRLFQSSNPNYSPDGKKIIDIMGDEEIEKRF